MTERHIKSATPTNLPPVEGQLMLELARRHLQKAASLRSDTTSYLLGLAQASYLGGAFEAAETACRQCLQTEPANFKALLLLGETQLRLKQAKTAFKTAMQAARLNKTSEDAWLLATRAAAEAGEHQHAIECLEFYLKQSKDQLVGPLAYILLARIYLETGLARQALDQLEQAHARLRSFYIQPGPGFEALRARILLHLERPSEAMESFRQALALAPGQADLHNEFGNALLENQRYDEALKAFREALQLEPDNAQYHCNAGIAARLYATTPGQNQQLAESLQNQSIDLLSKATQLNPVAAQYWHELALAQQVAGNYKQMKKALTQALAQSPAFEDGEASQVSYLRLYAAACQKLGDFKKASQALNDIMALLPDDHQTLNDLGELNYQLGDYTVAFNYFRKAETLALDNPVYLANMSRALLRLERLEEARELIEEAYGVQPDDYRVRFQLGAVLLAVGLPGEALEHLREAASHQRDNAEFRYSLGKAYLQLGQLSEAIHEYQEAITFAPLQHRWHAELGEIFLRERSYLPALESLRLAHQIAPNGPNYCYNLSVALAANGDILGAIYNLREGMTRQPQVIDADWHYLLGRLLGELGRQDEALTSFAQALELEPENPQYKVDLARCLRLKGEPIEQVKPLLEEAIAVDPLSLSSFEELAYIYEASNQPEEALSALEARLETVLETVRAL